MISLSLGDILFIIVVCAVIYGILFHRRSDRICESKEKSAMPQSDADIRKILSTHKTIAMVGASSNPDRPSNHVLEYLLQAGYTVYPVNPKDEQLFGQKVYRRLEDIPHSIDIVDVFRNPADAPEVAREAVKAGAKVLWLQEGVVSEEAARIADEGGLLVVMDHCMLKEHQRLKI